MDKVYGSIYLICGDKRIVFKNLVSELQKRHPKQHVARLEACVWKLIRQDSFKFNNDGTMTLVKK